MGMIVRVLEVLRRQATVSSELSTSAQWHTSRLPLRFRRRLLQREMSRRSQCTTSVASASDHEVGATIVSIRFPSIACRLHQASAEGAG